MAGRVVTAVALLSCGLVASLAAQTPSVHYRQTGDMPPGAIGRWQLLRGGPLPGYFQPVEISAPPGAWISLAVDGRFDEPAASPRRAGMLIGSVYRLRVTNIPLHLGAEVFPTVEVIHRLFPPPGREWHFPVPIDLTQEELVMALHGNLVTRVIYLEDPQQAVPAAEIEGRQTWFEAGPGEDPLQVADRLGRPMAILRMGGIVPEHGEADAQFLYGSPPLWVMPAAKKPAAAEERPLVAPPAPKPAPAAAPPQPQPQPAPPAEPAQNQD